jgi:hypothetical protein
MSLGSRYPPSGLNRGIGKPTLATGTDPPYDRSWLCPDEVAPAIDEFRKMALPEKLNRDGDSVPSDRARHPNPALECAVITPDQSDAANAPAFDRIFDDIVKPASEFAGLFPRRLEWTLPLGPEALREFVAPPMAVCIVDSTSPSAHFILGVRAAAGKPTILAIEAGVPAPYEIPGITSIVYRPELRYRDVVEDQKALAAALIEVKTASLRAASEASIEPDGGIGGEQDELDTSKMLQLIYYQINALQAEVQLALHPAGAEPQPAAEDPAVEIAVADETAPPLEQGEKSYLLARKLYANGASHKEIFQSLKLARNKLIDALRLAQESGTALRIHDLLKKTTEFEKYLLG